MFGSWRKRSKEKEWLRERKKTPIWIWRLNRWLHGRWSVFPKPNLLLFPSPSFARPLRVLRRPNTITATISEPEVEVFGGVRFTFSVQVRSFISLVLDPPLVLGGAVPDLSWKGELGFIVGLRMMKHIRAWWWFIVKLPVPLIWFCCEIGFWPGFWVLVEEEEEVGDMGVTRLWRLGLLCFSKKTGWVMKKRWRSRCRWWFF